MRNIFEIYESVPGWEQATIDIEAIIKIARKQVFDGVDVKTAYKEINAVMHKYDAWGTGDTEPRWAAAKMFCKGTDLDPDDFYI
jgi:hypothetical protein